MVGGDGRNLCMIPYFLDMDCLITSFLTRPLPNNALFRMVRPAESLSDAIKNADAVVCGIPFAHGINCFCEDRGSVPLTDLQRCLRKRMHIFGGLIPSDFLTHCEERAIKCHDFMKDEPLAIFLSVATAEGAILEALMHKNTLLHDSKTLVLGYGRCGMSLAERLKGLNARVTICTRSSTALAKAYSSGFDTLSLSLLKEKISSFEYIFNTIPACYLDEDCLSRTNSDCLIIDIASSRLGADYEAATRLSREILFCPGLPGRYATATCGKQLAEYVLSTLTKTHCEPKQKGV